MKDKKKASKYTDEVLQTALTEIKNGSPIGTVAKQFGIPKTTLFYKYKGILKPEVCKPGPQCLLGDEDEENLVRWILHMSDHGFPVTKNQLMNSVQMILNSQKKKVFENNMPGKHWYSAFRARHPQLTERMSRNLAHGRAVVNVEKIKSWFNYVTEYLGKKDLLNIPPSRSFNCDESAFFLCPKGEKVLAQKGEKLSYNFTNNDDKENLTTLFCGNAAGDLAPPMVMFKYVRMPAHIPKSLPTGWGIGLSENGWMTSKSFYEWVTNIFYPWLVKKDIEFPVILFLDGHSSHLTLPLSEFCREKRIELIVLLPNATHILQPLDVGLFRALKKSWSEAVRDWRFANGGSRMRREDFGNVMLTAVTKLELNSILPNAFRASGLHPLSVDGIDLKKFFKESFPAETESLPSQNFDTQHGVSIKDTLQLIENIIPPEILEFFQSLDNEPDNVYTGPIEHKSLYEFYKKMKTLLGPASLSEPNVHEQVNK